MLHYADIIFIIFRYYFIFASFQPSHISLMISLIFHFLSY
jgi:hypothetical protein